MTKPRITLIARADNTGLGSQTWEFYRHMKPDKTYVIDLNSINRTIGKKTSLHMERYPDGRIIEGFPTKEACEVILADTDILFTVETPYNYWLFSRARQLGVKTILQYNYEFLDYLAMPDLPRPDLLMAPSMWHLPDVEREIKISFIDSYKTEVKFIPVPTNRQVLPFKQRTKASNFLHVAGHPTWMDRNGTIALLQCLPFIKSKDIKITIYSQYPIDVLEDPRVIVKHMDVDNYWDIYTQDHDVLVLPRRYGGLSLQLNESLSVGMPVIMTDVDPQNRFLPREMLFNTLGADIIQTRTQIECHKPDLKALAAKIDQLFKDSQLVKDLSSAADQISDDQSWQSLLPIYEEAFKQLCQVAS